MATLNIDALFDAIGNFFGMFNQTAALGGNAVAAMNTTDNQANLGSIGILILLFMGLGLAWKSAGGPKIKRTIEKFGR